MFLRVKIRNKDGKRRRDFSVVEHKRVAAGRGVQKHVLHLGEINDSQERAWRRSIEAPGEAAQVFFNRETRLFKPVRNAKAMMRAVGVFLEPIAKAGGVGQQVMKGQRRRFPWWQARAKLGQEARHRIVERDSALFDQTHRRRGNEGLGHGGEAKNVDLPHRAAFLPVGEACHAAVSGRAVLGDKDDGANDGFSAIARSMAASSRSASLGWIVIAKLHIKE